ncbi:MAG: tRNA-queuosine alpha-mannosyltransferase domain-containing protein [Candidatus Krumholzibacteriia bacterium]
MSPLDILFVEPYDGGSHRAFREGLAARSRHRFHAWTLPARFWKWRLRGAAPWFADAINAARPPCDLILATDFLNVADFRGLLDPPYDRRPLLLYMHENQLTYPLSPEEEFDFHFGATNIVSALAADRVVFNSDYHRSLFLDGIPAYLGRMPEAIPRGVRARLEARSEVLPVGLARPCRPAAAGAPYLGGACAADAGPVWPRDGASPLILWNHRWEFDKRPEWLIGALLRLAAEAVPFRVALLGDPRGREELFAPLREALGRRVAAWGEAPAGEAYAAWLARADVVVSCAAQEYFGIAVAEAVHAGAYAVLPREQVYPTLYGRRCRGRHLYDGEAGLTALLRDVLAGRCGHVCGLPPACDDFCWERLAPRYDAVLAALAATGGKEGPRAGSA